MLRQEKFPHYAICDDSSFVMILHGGCTAGKMPSRGDDLRPVCRMVVDASQLFSIFAARKLDLWSVEARIGHSTGCLLPCRQRAL